MKDKLPLPTCFVVMPFGKKAPPGENQTPIDFDRIFTFIEKAVCGVKLECIRADFEVSGGFIHRPMFERLLLAEYVIADLSLANPNVAYEVGVRHGCGAKVTLLICSASHMKELPFDLRPFRIMPYELSESGTMSDEEGEKLSTAIGEHLKRALQEDLPIDNPILQLTNINMICRVEHEKTDAFIKRVRYASEMGERVENALLQDRTKAIALLKELEHEVLAGPQVIAQLHSVLISIYLGYRQKKAFAEMIDLYNEFPKELQRTPVALEQLALALNRVAEGLASKADAEGAKRYRQEALGRLNALKRQKWTSETFGIAGRIYKGQADAEMAIGNTRKYEAALQLAIDYYEQGFRWDPRDYYPGVNAVTLRLTRGSKEDLRIVEGLAQVVKFSVERAPAPKDSMEQYWQEATKLELAGAMKKWDEAQALLRNILGITAESFMRETTIKNLRLQIHAFRDDANAINVLEEIITGLSEI